MANPKDAKGKTGGTKEKAERYEIRFSGKNGAEMKARAVSKGGNNVSYTFHSVKNAEGKRVPGQGRGATAKHPSFEAAKAAVDQIAGSLEKLGWTRKAKGSFGQRADAYGVTNLPKPE